MKLWDLEQRFNETRLMLNVIAERLSDNYNSLDKHLFDRDNGYTNE